MVKCLMCVFGKCGDGDNDVVIQRKKFHVTISRLTSGVPEHVMIISVHQHLIFVPFALLT